MIKKNTAPEGMQTSNRILTGTTFKGEIDSEGDLRIDGTHEGTVRIRGKLVVGEKGRVKGEVFCTNATVSGLIIGKIEVGELLSLQASAKLEGDIITNRLSIEPGAEFTGKCSMGAVVREIKNNEQEDSRKLSRKEETA